MNLSSIAVIAATAGLSSASVVEQNQEFGIHDNRTGGPTLSICIDLLGFDSWDGSGDPSNDIYEEFLGAGTVVVGTRWEDIELTTNGNSFLNEATIGFNGEVALRVGAADNFSGSGTYSSDGIFDFMENEIDYVLDDGMLSLEFFETLDDSGNAIDSFYRGGKLTIYYIPLPAPGVLGLAGLGGLVLSRRRRS